MRASRVRGWVTCLGLVLSQGSAAGLSDRAYERTVDLVSRLYLYPDQVDAPGLLHAAANGLADEVDWLVIEEDGDSVWLRHGDGSAIGSVSVANMETLPEALQSLEALVVESGYELGDVDVRAEILKGMTSALDRYSRLLTGERLERFDERLNGTLVGVGATLRQDGAYLVVDEVSADGPAQRGGIVVGDVVVRIDGEPTTNMPLREATRRIRGDIDTTVVLTVERRTVEIDLTLLRAEVAVPNVVHKPLKGGVGYLAIDHFSNRTLDNLTAAIGELRAQGSASRGLVLDLRGNTGGVLREAARSADFFVKRGLLIRTAGPDGGHVQNLQGRMDAEDSGDEPQVPLVILVDDRTASGSEILAGALQELDRAVIVGTRTYGKGTVQKLYTLEEAARKTRD